MRNNEDIENAPRGPRPLPLEDVLVDMHRTHPLAPRTNQVFAISGNRWRVGLSIVLIAGLAVLAAAVLFR